MSRSTKDASSLPVVSVSENFLVLFNLQSFFDGWDVTKKKDKTKGRHDSLLSREYLCTEPCVELCLRRGLGVFHFFSLL